MRAIRKMERAPGVTYVPNIEKPVCGPDEVLFKVKATAICGTDVSTWRWNEAGIRFADKYEMPTPMTMGHECCGIVEEVGANVTGFQVGDHVAIETHIYCGTCYQCRTGDAHNCQHLKIYGVSCDGCFAEYATAPASCAYKLPESISFEQGALFEPAGVALFGLQESGMQPGDTVMIYGCGPIGQMAIQLALAYGAGKVIAVDIQDSRVEQARALGAIGINSAKEDLVAAVQSICAERGGADVIIEVSGAPNIYDNMADCLRKEGHIMLLAHPGARVSFDIMKTMHHSGATIKGIFGRRIWKTWDELTDMVVSGKVDLTKVVTHRFPLSKAQEAFDVIPQGAGKVIFYPEWED